MKGKKGGTTGLARSHGKGRGGSWQWRHVEEKGGGPGGRQLRAPVRRIGEHAPGKETGERLEERGGEWAGFKKKVPGLGPR
jgi:hypothetical protein